MSDLGFCVKSLAGLDNDPKSSMLKQDYSDWNNKMIIKYGTYLSLASLPPLALGHPLLAKLGPGGTDSPRFDMGQDCLWDSEEQHRK